MVGSMVNLNNFVLILSKMYFSASRRQSEGRHPDAGVTLHGSSERPCWGKTRPRRPLITKACKHIIPL